MLPSPPCSYLPDDRVNHGLEGEATVAKGLLGICADACLLGAPPTWREDKSGAQGRVVSDHVCGACGHLPLLVVACEVGLTRRASMKRTSSHPPPGLSSRHPDALHTRRACECAGARVCNAYLGPYSCVKREDITPQGRLRSSLPSFPSPSPPVLLPHHALLTPPSASPDR